MARPKDGLELLEGEILAEKAAARYYPIPPALKPGASTDA